MPLKLSHEELPSINLTSMIDVLFLLIIFFMVGTRFSENEGTIEINLPKVSQAGAMLTPPKGKIVSLKSDGSVVFDGQSVTQLQLEQSLLAAKANYPDIQIQFEADGTCSHQNVCEVLATIQKTGSKIDLKYAKTQMPQLRR